MAAPVSNTETPVVPWQEDPVHFTLDIDKTITTFGAVQPTLQHTPVWHTHSEDTVCISLTNASLAVEQPTGIRQSHLCPGDAIIYELRGRPPHVHRVVESSHTLAFLCAEVHCERLPKDARRGVLSIGTLVSQTDFASVTKIEVQAGKTVPLARRPALAPVRSLICGLEGKEVEVRVAPGTVARRVGKKSEGVYVGAVVVENKEGGRLVEDAGCVLVNNSESVWNGVIVDIWGVPGKET